MDMRLLCLPGGRPHCVDRAIESARALEAAAPTAVAAVAGRKQVASSFGRPISTPRAGLGAANPAKCRAIVPPAVTAVRAVTPGVAYDHLPRCSPLASCYCACARRSSLAGG